MRILGIIPARGGSKGIPLKNIYPLNGKPLIQYTIDAAEKAGLDYVVTTDSPEIAAHSDRVILRPHELSQGEPGSILNTVRHAVKGREYDAVMILQPTSPLRTAEDIMRARVQYMAYPAECLVSVCKGVHPMKSYTLTGKPLLEQSLYDKHLHGCYTRNGAIFITSKTLLDSGRLFDDQPLLYVMPKTRSIDIDDYEDLAITEALLKAQGGLINV